MSFCPAADAVAAACERDGRNPGAFTLHIFDPWGHMFGSRLLQGEEPMALTDAAFEDSNGRLPHEPGYRGHLSVVSETPGEVIPFPVIESPEDIAA